MNNDNQMNNGFNNMNGSMNNNSQMNNGFNNMNGSMNNNSQMNNGFNNMNGSMDNNGQMNYGFNNMNGSMNNNSQMNNGFNNMNESMNNNYNSNMQPMNNNYNGMNYSNNGEHKNNKMIIIIISVIFGVLAIVGIILIVQSGSSKDKVSEKRTEYIEDDKSYEEYKKELEKESQELSKNISTEYIQLADGDYLIIVENKSNKPIMVNGTVEFYNDDKITYTKETTVGSSYVAPGAKGYATISNYDLKDINFNKLVPKMIAYPFIFKMNGDKLTYEVEKKEDNLLVSVTNNSNVKIEGATIEVLFYDGTDKIIGYSDGFISSDLTAGSTRFKEIHIPYDKNYDEIPYSRYEVFVTASSE